MKLKIATWNLQRPRHSSTRNRDILDKLKEVDADILVLTETNSIINPEGYHAISSNGLNGLDPDYYRPGEIRTTVWSKVPSQYRIDTYDPNTSVCTVIPHAFGSLTVYGTVIGVFGNRHQSFLPELKAQVADWERVVKDKGNICIAGDFNLSFVDSYYYTKIGRQLIDDCFRRLGIRNLTRNIKENIDHIAVSESSLQDVKQPNINVWNQDKKRLSDHKGVWVEFETSTDVIS